MTARMRLLVVLLVSLGCGDAAAPPDTSEEPDGAAKDAALHDGDASILLDSGLTMDGGAQSDATVTHDASIVLDGDTTIPDAARDDGGPSAIACEENTNVLWSAGGEALERAAAIAVLADGTSYLAGYFTDTTLLGGHMLTSAGGQDLFVAKVLPDQSVAWAHSAGGPGQDGAYAISEHGGAIFIAGTLTGEAQFGDEILQADKGRSFVAKYDDDGALIWVALGDGSGPCIGNGVAALPDGGAYVVGSTHSDCLAYQDPTGVPVPIGGYGWFIARYSREGEVLWIDGMSGHDFDEANAVVAHPDGGAYVTGTISHRASFGLQLERILAASEGAFLVRYRDDGSTEWVQTSESEGGATGYSLALGSDGAIYAGGQFFGGSGEPASEAVFGTKSIVGNQNLYVAKYLPSGEVEWVNGFVDDGRWASAQGLAVTEDGDVYATGNLLVSYAAVYPVTAYEVFLAKFDAASGELAWRELAVSEGGMYRSSRARGIALSECWVHVVGDFVDRWQFGDSWLNSAGSEDLFSIRVSRDR